MDADDKRNKKHITFDLIKRSLNELKKFDNLIAKINIDKMIEFSKKIECFIKMQKHFPLFKRNIRNFQRYIINNKQIKFSKNNYINQAILILNFIIASFKNLIDTKDHKNIQKGFLFLIKLSNNKILPYEIFIIIIKLILILLNNFLKLNNDSFYSIDEEPFNIINDIIISLISLPEEINIEKSNTNNTNIFFDLLELFDNYLFSKYSKNSIILSGTPIFLKLLENHEYILINQSKNSINKNNIAINNKLEIQKKLYAFLVKIYKFSMRNDYIENIIIKNSILDLNYYLNSLNFLMDLFLEEIKDIPLCDFKIKDGIFIPKNKFVFLDNIKPKFKTNEISLIFSFKIFQKEIDKLTDILEIYDTKKKSILKLYINKKGFLTLEQNENIKLETEEKIQENIYYFFCITFNNNTFNNQINLFVNGVEKLCYKKANNLDFSKEFSLVLGKNNFIGVIGELLMINKAIITKKIKHLFDLKEDYANILRKINYNFKMFPKRIILKYKINYNNSTKIQKSKEFFKKLDFEIIFDLNPNDVLYPNSKNKYMDINNKEFLFKNKERDTPELKANINNKEISYIKKNFFSLDKKNIILFKNMSKMNYSYDTFYLNNGIDFLSFQLYNIFSKIKDIQLLNLYLYETLSFIMKLFSCFEKNFMTNEENKRFEPEVAIFFITLLNLLQNNKEKIYLKENIILSLIELYIYFSINKLINERNIILSILLDIDYYKNKEDIFKYPQIFIQNINELKEKPNYKINIINKEFLYKLLSLDFCFETKELNYKLFRELISGFILLDEKSKKDKPKLNEFILNEFINYFLNLANKVKIYKYLKIIYFNFDNFKEILKNNLEFNQTICEYMEKIDYKHCKYCEYNQILYYLINQEITIYLYDDVDKMFRYSSFGFMINPSFLFLKCFLSQFFNISNKNRIKFIKMDSDQIDFIFTLINEDNEVFNYEKFPKKFENIIGYLKLLVQQTNLKDTNSYDKMLFCFNFIINFLKRMVKNGINKKEMDEKIKQKKGTLFDEKRNKLQYLLSEENMTNFFDIYLYINYETAVKDLKYFLNISFENITLHNSFLFILKKYIFNRSASLNNNQFELFSFIVDELNNYKITFDINEDAIIVTNNISFLICLYNFIINNNLIISPDLEPILLLFFNHLTDINFYNSKYVFDVNLNLEEEQKRHNYEKKFILEMVCDIYFHFYEKSNFNKAYQCLIQGIFLKEKILDLFRIDNQNFLEEKNMDKIYIFYNNKFLGNIANGEERQDIIFSIYFLEYLYKKLDYYKNETKININEYNEPFNFILEIMQLLLDKTYELFNQYYKKIIILLKNLHKKNLYKSYTKLFEYIKDKYKSKDLSIDKLIEYYKKPTLSKEIKFPRKGKRENKAPKIIQNTFLENNKILNSNKQDMINVYVERKNTGNLKLSLQKIKVEERKIKSFSHKSSIKINIDERFGFEENSGQNDMEGNESRKKNKIYLKLDNSKSKNTLNINNLHSKISDNSEKNSVNNITDKIKPNYLKERLNEMNIPFFHFKNFFSLSDSKAIKQLFNPKEYYIWNKFNHIFKKVIFSQKKFIHLTNLFKMKFRKDNIIKSSILNNRDFSLKYPIKLKNFICDDYYQPFTKPDLNFFNNKIINVTHPYLNSEFLNESKYDIDKINDIKFTPMIPNDNDSLSHKIVCENVSNKGSYFGYLYLNHAFLLFISSSEKDPRKKGKSKTYKNIKDEQFYLYSFFLDDRITDKNKYIIIFNSEIKEIVIRRFCFNYIGYEIFLKNNKSYLFNFFNKENCKNFMECLIVKIEENEKEEMYNQLMSKSFDIISGPFFDVNINEEINFTIVKEPVIYFEEKDYFNKHAKRELSNFKYLLLLNKYSGRSYNDLYQYLIFPLLFMDVSRKKERDLSKPIALNKEPENYQDILEKIESNYINFGSHFNSNYSTSGYVFYYLVRMNPFTSGLIKLQSNKFDVPERMFFTIYNHLNVLTSTVENRELVPEFFYNYEIFLNLNYLNLGYLKKQKLIINDLDTGDKNGIAEFIINMRQQLEKVNITHWVDNIFGCNQDPKNIENSNNIYNVYPSSAYEQNNNYELKKRVLKKKGKNDSEIINEIKEDLNILSVGMIPIQLFKTSSKKKKILKIISNTKETNIKQINEKSIGHNFAKEIENFLKTYLKEKSKLFLLEDNFGQKLVILSKKILYIFRLFINENKSNLIKKELWQKKQVKILPQSKMLCELSKGILISCRYSDKIMQINYKDKNKFLIYHENIVTSIEFISHEERSKNKNIIYHSNNLIFGDEIGYLNLMKIEYNITNKKQMEIEKIKILKNIKAHNSLIQGILFDKRLNIIISYSEEGQISINNAFDLNVLNIIELGNEFYIKDIKISEYNLIYIYCINKENNKFNYIKCYSLNGIKFTELITEKKIINFFVEEHLLVVYENNFFESFNLYEIDGNPLYQHELDREKNITNKIENKTEKKVGEELEKNENCKIILCAMNNLEKKLIIIYEDHHVLIEDLSLIFSKM